MNSAISPDETRPGDSKTLLFVPNTPLRFGAIRPLKLGIIRQSSRKLLNHV